MDAVDTVDIVVTLSLSTQSTQSTPSTRSMRVPLFLAVMVSLVLLPGLVSCGGKKRPPPLPPVSQPGGRTAKPTAEAGKALAAIAEAPRIRLLLQERFKSVVVRRSKLAPTVLATTVQKRITLYEGSRASGKPLRSGTGFRLEPAGAEPLLLNDVPYRGAIEIFINPLSVPVVVNELDLEDYLRGAVPNELHPSRFPYREALKAQAVAARTFAFYHLGSYVKRGFDIYSDERSQVYSGVKGEHPLADSAISATRGVLIMHRRQPILAVYSSTCGGKTESYAGMFQKDLPYLKGGVECSDEISPFHAWEHKCQASGVESRLNRRGAFGHLRKIESLRKGVSGRVIEMRVSGSKGQFTLKGNDIRFVFGLRSNLIVDMKTKKNGNGDIAEITVKGKGWGHGVGLCQYGAVALAQKGQTYDRILKRYYNDVELKRNH